MYRLLRIRMPIEPWNTGVFVVYGPHAGLVGGIRPDFRRTSPIPDVRFHRKSFCAGSRHILGNTKSMNTSTNASSAQIPGEAVVGSPGFVDRRTSGSSLGSSERRQFGSSHSGLSTDGQELAKAIDQYKLENHRRYITCDEMLTVMRALGYSKT